LLAGAVIEQGLLAADRPRQLLSPLPRMVHRRPIVRGFCWCVVSPKWLRSFAAATGAECGHLVMGRREVAHALELVRALRHQLHEMTTQLARVERQDVTGRNGLGRRNGHGSIRVAPRHTRGTVSSIGCSAVTRTATSASTNIQLDDSN
jgi:hypothetical protein